jgi:hypothetical protein
VRDAALPARVGGFLADKEAAAAREVALMVADGDHVRRIRDQLLRLQPKPAQRCLGSSSWANVSDALHVGCPLCEKKTKSSFTYS